MSKFILISISFLLISLFSFSYNPEDNKLKIKYNKSQIEAKTQAFIDSLSNSGIKKIVTYNESNSTTYVQESYLITIMNGKADTLVRKGYYPLSYYILWSKGKTNYIKKIDNISWYNTIEYSNDSIFNYIEENSNTICSDKLTLDVKKDTIIHPDGKIEIRTTTNSISSNKSTYFNIKISKVIDCKISFSNSYLKHDINKSKSQYKLNTLFRNKIKNTESSFKRENPILLMK